MAHADYDCCAICDSKMGYSGVASETKEALCPDCIDRTASLGRLCIRISDVRKHLSSLDDGAALKWLHDVGFSPCYYENDLDAGLIERGLIEIGVPDAGKWGKRLKAAPETAQ